MNVDSTSSKLYFRSEPKKDSNFSPSVSPSRQNGSYNTNIKTRKFSLVDKIQIASLIGAIPCFAVHFISLIPKTITFIEGKQNKFLNNVFEHSRNIGIGFGAIFLSTILYRKLEDSQKSKKSCRKAAFLVYITNYQKLSFFLF